MVILVAFITFVNISSQKVQRLGFMRLGRSPTTRNGTDSTPRSAIGRCMFCQHPLQISAWVADIVASDEHVDLVVVLQHVGARALVPAVLALAAGQRPVDVGFLLREALAPR